MKDEDFLNLYFDNERHYGQDLLNAIAKTTDSEVLKYLNWYKDILIRDMQKDKKFREWRSNLLDIQPGKIPSYSRSDENKIFASKLREFADCIEKPGMHFAIGGVIPELPLFQNGEYFGTIELTFVKGPLGG